MDALCTFIAKILTKKSKRYQDQQHLQIINGMKGKNV